VWFERTKGCSCIQVYRKEEAIHFLYAWYVTTPDVKFVRLMSYADESDEDDASYIQTCDSKASKSGAVVDSIRVGSESKYDKDDPVQLLAPVPHKSIVNASPR
jgi:hypothetical protein